MQSSFRNTPRLAITTSVKESTSLTERAQQLANQLNALYISRNDLSIQQLFAETGVERILVVRDDRMLLFGANGDEYQFHPNLAIVRAANFMKHGSDHFLEAVKLSPGELVLDCTLGFGSEALLAAMVVGPEGEVVGLESAPDLAIITREGMQCYQLQQKKLEAIMRTVIVLNVDYRDYLRLSSTRSVDLVYFDPFFNEHLERSSQTIGPLAAFGNRSPLDFHSITEARRVSRRIVVIKHAKWHKLPQEILSQVSDVVCGRRSTVAYSIIAGFGVSE